jgi:shikimate kinase
VTVVLIGAPATGKTQVGKRVAQYLGVDFIDTDAEIVRKHGPIPKIFATHGETYFREREREEVATALTRPAVVSLGGGAVLNPQTRGELATAHVVLLTMTRTAALERIVNNKRPLVTGIESWEKLAASRRDLYESLADYTADTSRRPITTIAREITDWVTRKT